jgi:hypothetical protein
MVGAVGSSAANTSIICTRQPAVRILHNFFFQRITANELACGTFAEGKQVSGFAVNGTTDKSSLVRRQWRFGTLRRRYEGVAISIHSLTLSSFL